MTGPEQRWLEIVAAGADREQASAAWREIAAAYGEPWRHYHTLDHIDALLRLRLQHAEAFRDAAAVDFAILLHDVVYRPERTDNEAASAAFARARLAHLGQPAARIDTIAHLIELSRHDAASIAGLDGASDAALFLDLDLSVLAAEPHLYAAYARAIRAEYAIYPDAAYRAGRTRVLTAFLQRPRLYVSDHLGPIWEAPARHNIAAEIASLAGG